MKMHQETTKQQNIGYKHEFQLTKYLIFEQMIIDGALDLSDHVGQIQRYFIIHENDYHHWNQM
jgi:hypothetical protein